MEFDTTSMQYRHSEKVKKDLNKNETFKTLNFSNVAVTRQEKKNLLHFDWVKVYGVVNPEIWIECGCINDKTTTITRSIQQHQITIIRCGGELIINHQTIDVIDGLKIF